MLRYALQRQLSLNPRLLDKKLVSSKIEQTGFPYFSDFIGHFSCVNAVGFSPNGYFLCSGGDDTRVLVWPVFANPEDRAPHCALRGHMSNIFCTIFEKDNRHIISCGNDRQILRYDLGAGTSLPIAKLLRHKSAVYRVSISSSDPNLVLSASEDGFIYAWDLRTANPQSAIYSRGEFTSVDFNPVDGNCFATGHAKDGARLWDLRLMGTSTSAAAAQKVSYIRHYWTLNHKLVTGVSFSRDGRRLVTSVKRSIPMVFDIRDADPRLVCYHKGYRNITTMKGITFGGQQDEYILSGSDDFTIYIWKVPTDLDSLDADAFMAQDVSIIPTTVHNSTDDVVSGVMRNGDAKTVGELVRSVMTESSTVAKAVELQSCVLPRAACILFGHRSIVNNLAYHPTEPVFVSSGVEKYIRLWSPFPLSKVDSNGPRPQRKRTEPIIGRFNNRDLFIDDTQESTAESLHTLALFDFFNAYSNTEQESDSESDDFEDDFAHEDETLPRFRRLYDGEELDDEDRYALVVQDSASSSSDNDMLVDEDNVNATDDDSDT